MFLMKGPAGQTQTVFGREITSTDKGFVLAKADEIDVLKAFGFKTLINGERRVDPGANDDSFRGFTVGSLIQNLDSEQVFLCTDDSKGAALWKPVTLDEAYALLEVGPRNAVAPDTAGSEGKTSDPPAPPVPGEQSPAPAADAAGAAKDAGPAAPATAGEAGDQVRAAVGEFLDGHPEPVKAPPLDALKEALDSQGS